MLRNLLDLFGNISQVNSTMFDYILTVKKFTLRILFKMFKIKYENANRKVKHDSIKYLKVKIKNSRLKYEKL